MDKFLKIVNYLPLILITLGLIAFVVAGYIFNAILGTCVLGLALIVTGIMLIPMKIGGDKDV